MISQVLPDLDGIAAERFRALVQQVIRCQGPHRAVPLKNLREVELRWSRNEKHLNGSKGKYEACAQVLLDLAHLKYRLREDRFGIELIAPDRMPRKGMSQDDIRAAKDAVRRELEPICAEQFADPHVRRFIRQMEKPRASSKCEPIGSLIADGREIAARLHLASKADGSERDELLSQAVKPYLQLVEEKVRDSFTNHYLGDIWRYFRYTWSIPQTATPGRQLLYLVRDAGHPNHAVMGILSFNNSAMQNRERDNFIGWTFERFAETIVATAEGPDATAGLTATLSFLESLIERALQGIEIAKLASPDEIRNPDSTVIRRLKQKAQEFAGERRQSLRDCAEDLNLPLTMQETDGAFGLPPVSDEVLRLERKSLGQIALTKSRRMLVGKKRAFELARLLEAKFFLRKQRSRFLDPGAVQTLLREDPFRLAVTTALLSAKSTNVGINMLELTTCGAVKPYNSVLGGKLAALLALSPQIAADYARRYGNEASIISSQMKNQPVQKEVRLVYIGTTSLYSIGSSQYERLRVPAGTISPEQPDLEFKAIGLTSGYGTIQFSADTVRSLEAVLETERGYQEVNSVFGEGFSPRLRKLRAGLELLGFDPEALMMHHEPRRIYGAFLCPQGHDFLIGREVDLPDYIRTPQNFPKASESIADLWRKRWLSKRISFIPAMEALEKSQGWKLSDLLPVEDDDLKLESEFDGFARTVQSNTNMEPEVAFWRSLAGAGAEVCADFLNPEAIERLHVQSPIEDFLLQKVRDGFSLVVTGNAGDGKTHLLKRLKPALEAAGARVEYDATAAMKKGDWRIIVNDWKKALADHVPYCLAANEFPLYQLCQKGRAELPLLDEVERQRRNRLHYGDAAARDEDARDSILVVDLSLRNPLAPNFVSSLLAKLTQSLSLAGYAKQNPGSNFEQNFLRLSHPDVQSRLVHLFQRIAQRGERAPVRELWILLCKALFGNETNSANAVASQADWYSELIFDEDARFHLSALLRAISDPAKFSHPQIDRLLDGPEGTKPSDWRVDGKVPTAYVDGLDRARFAFLKRRFYFEHKSGAECFDLERDYEQEFVDTVTEAKQPNELFTAHIIEAINLCYCPKKFSGSDAALYLWVGHRFHEMPSVSFIANDSIPRREFEVLVPKLPSRIEGAAIDYVADHFLLRHSPPNKAVRSLKIDYGLFKTLRQLRNGLPRHLLPEKYLNRLDSFVEALQADSSQSSPRFVLFNARRQSASIVTLSNDFSKYIEVSEVRGNE